MRFYLQPIFSGTAVPEAALQPHSGLARASVSPPAASGPRAGPLRLLPREAVSAHFRPRPEARGAPRPQGGSSGGAGLCWAGPGGPRDPRQRREVSEERSQRWAQGESARPAPPRNLCRRRGARAPAGTRFVWVPHAASGPVPLGGKGRRAPGRARAALGGSCRGAHEALQGLGLVLGSGLWWGCGGSNRETERDFRVGAFPCAVAEAPRPVWAVGSSVNRARCCSQLGFAPVPAHAALSGFLALRV